jgi:glycosyltransferase involved in cell wall biosynthesis
MPKVSVIIPVYNGEKYIAEAIRSVLDQSFQDLEIVITDDGSTDGTVSRITQFNDPRIRLLLFDRNRGVAAATNNSITHSRGELVSIIDSDNVFLPSKLEKQVDFLSKHPEIGAVFTKVRLIDDEGGPLEDPDHPYIGLFEQHNRTRHDWLRHFFFKNNCLCHPSVVIRRECYEKVGYYDRRLSQLLDLDLWIRLCLHYEIFILPEDLLEFRIRDDDSNLSGQSKEALARHDWQASQILDNYLKIPNTEELLKIFPEADKFGDSLDDELIAFYVAMLAFDGSYTPAKFWALDTLYDLLGSPVREKLTDVAGFEEIDFIRLTADPDVFDLGRKIRLQEKQIHKLDRLSHELSGVIHRQQQRIATIEKSVSWKMTRPLREIWSRLRVGWISGRFKSLPGNSSDSGILLECDRVTYSAESLDVSGWALSEKGILKIEVYYDGRFLGDASYGLERADVHLAYPHLKNSGNTGFHLQASLLDLPHRNEGQAVVLIKAVDLGNQSYEVTLPVVR